MNGAGKNFLAGAAFAFDQHRAGAGSDLRHQIEEALHHRAAPHDVFKRVAPFQFFTQLLYLAEILESFDAAQHFGLLIPQQSR